MIWTPRVTVAAIIERDGKFLLVEEIVRGQRVFNQPAGHLEAGESLLEAVAREALEETGRSFTANGIVGIYRWQKPGSEKTYLRFCFSGSASEPLADRALDPDIVKTLWLEYPALAGMAAQLRSPMVLRCIDDFLSREPLPLDVLHDVL